MKKYLVILVVLLSLNSCSDFLDVEPDLQISFNEQFSTEQGVQEIVSGIYSDTEGLASSIFHIYPDYIGGNVAFTPSVTNREVTIFNTVDTSYPFQETPVDSDYTSFYGDSYNVINQINLVLERLESLNFIEDSRKSQLKAELLTIRALTHYNLSLLFAQNYGFTSDGSHIGIVYNTSTIDVGTEFPSRSTVAENYSSMQTDLEEALSLFQNNSFLPVGPDYSYFNSINTQALYARIALQMNDWQTAATMSDNVITQSGLVLTPQLDYINQWLQINPLDEVLLQFTAPVNSDGGTGSSISAYYLFNSPTNYGRFSASLDLINLFETNDLRINLFQVESLPTVINGVETDEDYYFLNKFQGDSGTLQIRLSELFLIYAEAQERLAPGNTLALDRLNEVRERAGLSTLVAPSDMLEEVFMERRRELAFENSLFFDITRFKKDINRNDGCIAQVCDLSYPSNFYILPIPQASILSNENIIQNEGY